MAKFKITYTSGLVEEVDLTDASSVGECVAIKFGIDEATLTEHGTVIEMIDAGSETQVEEAAETVVDTATAEETPAE